MKQVLAILVLLAGCASGPLAPEGTDYIAVVSGSSFIGRSADHIYANDTLRREDQGANDVASTVTWQALPEGTYANSRAILAEGVPRIAEPEFDLCPTDMGANSMRFTQPIAGETSVSAGCMNNGYFPVRSQIMALLPPR
jgi:hypothetical protein